MWVFLSNAFLSIVAHRDKPDVLLVRARARPDIKRVFPAARVTTLATADYRYRAEISREVVAAAIADQVLGIDYPNFKNSVSEDPRHDAYVSVWTAMMRFQNRDGPAATRGRPVS